MTDGIRRAAAPELTDGSVRLRPWRLSDATAVTAACQDPDLQHWLPVPVPYLVEHAVGFVTEFAQQQWADDQGAPFAVEAAGSGELLGSVALKDIDRVGGTAEVGYWVVPGSRGRGVAQRAVSLISAWAFAALGLQRLEFRVEPANAASCVVAERVGAVFVEQLPASEVIHGTPRDTARYVLLGGA